MAIIPGNPQQILAFTDELATAATGFSEQADAVYAVSTGSWKGAASVAFSRRQEKGASDWKVERQRTYEAIQILADYARHVEDLQRQAAEAQDSLRVAQEKVKDPGSHLVGAAEVVAANVTIYTLKGEARLAAIRAANELNKITPRYLGFVFFDPYQADPSEIYMGNGVSEHLDWPLYEYDDNGNPIIFGTQAEQGRLGDCGLVAASMNLADTHPDYIRDAITENRDGTFTVRLYQNGKAVFVTVDRDMLTNGQGDPLLIDSPNHVLWPSIIEKAVAQYRGGFPEITGIESGDVFEMFTGVPSESEYFADGTRSLAELEQHIKDGGMITASTLTKENAEGHDWYRVANGKEHIFASHAYQVTDIDTAAGTVTIRNPHPGADTIIMSWDDFQENMRRVILNPGS